MGNAWRILREITVAGHAGPLAPVPYPVSEIKVALVAATGDTEQQIVVHIDGDQFGEGEPSVGLMFPAQAFRALLREIPEANQNELVERVLDQFVVDAYDVFLESLARSGIRLEEDVTGDAGIAWITNFYEQHVMDDDDPDPDPENN